MNKKCKKQKYENTKKKYKKKIHEIQERNTRKKGIQERIKVQRNDEAIQE